MPHRWTRREIFVARFGVGKYGVTAGEYLVFAEQAGYGIADELRTDPRFRDPRAPVAYVSWIDVARYAQWLARESGKPYRLVRDAECEKVARRGLPGRKYHWGDEPPEARADWNNPNGSQRVVGSFPPNGYGLHDMAGSMWSWCEACYEQAAPSDRARMIYDDTRLRDVRLNPICRGDRSRRRIRLHSTALTGTRIPPRDGLTASVLARR